MLAAHSDSSSFCFDCDASVWNRGGGLLSVMSFVLSRPHETWYDRPVGHAARHLPSRRGLVAALYKVVGASHFNCGIDGVFEAVRVVGGDLVRITEVHPIAAGAHLAETEPEMAHD